MPTTADPLCRPCSRNGHRRMSVEDSTSDLILSIRNTLERLTQLWDQVHMERSSREARVEYAYEHFHTLLRDIVSSEEEMILNVGKDIKARRLAISDLRKLFNMPEFDESPYPNGSITLLKALDKDLAVLQDRKEKIVQAQMDLYKELELLCHRTNTEMVEVNGIADTILDEKEMEEMRQMIPKLRDTLEERVQRLTDLQNECKKIHKTLGMNCSICSEELMFLECDFTSPTTIVGSQTIEKAVALEQKLKDQHDVWVEQVAFRYDELLVKLEELSQKCFLADRRFYPTDFNPEKQDNNDIQKMEEEVKQLQEKYQRGRPVFDKLNEWMSLWKEKLAGEQRVCRASFYNNRGGSIASTLKRQKQVAVNMNKAFEDLQTIVCEYVKQDYDEHDIMVEGMLPNKYAEYVMDEYERDKEMQKAQKQFARKHTECGQIKTLPRSVKRANAPTNTPATTTRATRKRSFSCSQLSVISPTSTPSQGPITSSPKPETHNIDFTSKTFVKSPIKTNVHKTPRRGVLTPSGKSSNRPWY